MGRVRGHIRQQFVAYIALFVALGGVSYAATSLPANSVGNRQLRKDAVTGSKVKDGSITGADVKESSLGKVHSAAKADAAVSLTPGGPSHPLQLLSGWTVAASSPTPSYYRDRDGYVHLSGQISGTNSTGSAIADLPRGFRLAPLPNGSEGFAQFTSYMEGTGSGEPQIFVTSDGLIESSSTGPFTFDRVSLDGISFRAGS